MPSKPTRKRTVTKAKVLETAAAQLNESGAPETLTLTKIAKALNIKTPSLYNHVAGMPGLLDDLTQYGLDQLAREMEKAAMGRSGWNAFIAVGHAYRNFAKAQPGLYPLVLRLMQSSATDIDTLQTMFTLMLRIAESFGFKDEEGYHFVRAWWSMVHGFVSLELSGTFASGHDENKSFEQMLTTFIRGL